MTRNAFRTAAVFLATLAIPATILATTRPASASDHMCETYGSNYCVGAPTLEPYQEVKETSTGRALTAHYLNQTFEGYAAYYLEFTTDTSLCVSTRDDLYQYDTIVIHTCGDYGTVWALHPDSSGHLRWINRYATNWYGADVYLSGHNNGTQYRWDPWGVNGDYQRFDWK